MGKLFSKDLLFNGLENNSMLALHLEINKSLKRKGCDIGKLSVGKNTGDFDPKELSRGTKVESEHTGDRKIAQRIAMDHLTEDPQYYVKLAKMEKHKSIKDMLDCTIYDLEKAVGTPRAIHKYIRREGTPGNYKYFYMNNKGEVYASPNPPMPEEIEFGKKVELPAEASKKEPKLEPMKTYPMGITGAKWAEKYNGMDIVDYGTGYYGLYKDGQFIAYDDRFKHIQIVADVLNSTKKKVWELTEKEATELNAKATKCYLELYGENSLNRQKDKLWDGFSILKKDDPKFIEYKKLNDRINQTKQEQNELDGPVIGAPFYSGPSEWTMKHGYEYKNIVHHIEKMGEYGIAVPVPEWVAKKVKENNEEIKLHTPMKEPIHQDPTVDNITNSYIKSKIVKAPPLLSGEMAYEQFWNNYYIGKEQRGRYGRSIQWLENLVKNSEKAVGRKAKDSDMDSVVMTIVKRTEPFQYGGKTGKAIALRAYLTGLANINLNH